MHPIVFYFQLPPASTSLLEVRRWACGRRQVEGGREGGRERPRSERRRWRELVITSAATRGAAEICISLSLSRPCFLSLWRGMRRGGGGVIIRESLLANSAAASSLPEPRLHPNEASWEFLLVAEIHSSLPLSPSAPYSHFVPFSPPLSQSVTFSALSPLLVFPLPAASLSFSGALLPLSFFCLGTRVRMTLLLHHAFCSRTTRFISALCASVSIIITKTKAVHESCS